MFANMGDSGKLKTWHAKNLFKNFFINLKNMKLIIIIIAFKNL